MNGTIDTENAFTLVKMLLLLFAILFLFIAQVIFLMRKKSKRDECIFTVTREGLNEQSEKIKSIFSKMKIAEKDMESSLLLLEEIVVRLEESANQVVTARVRNFFGKVSLLLSSCGEKYNPIEQAKSNGSETEDHFRDLIFKANAMRLSYKRFFTRNVIIIQAKN